MILFLKLTNINRFPNENSYDYLNLWGNIHICRFLKKDLKSFRYSEGILQKNSSCLQHVTNLGKKENSKIQQKILRTHSKKT